MVFRQLSTIVSALLLVWPVVGADAAGDPGVAGLQVALARERAYRGPIDGVDGPATAAAVRRFQARRGLLVDGIAGAQTLRALGRFALRRLGRRILRRGDSGADVAALEFELAWDGFPSGRFDGRFGSHVLGALRRFQRSRALPVDGIAGRRTFAALRVPPAVPDVRLSAPVAGLVGARFGPRGLRFHSGVDLRSPAGTSVVAAAAGRVVWTGPRDGWGLLVALADGSGIRTLYAHLSTVAVRLGQRVARGGLLGRVGATGNATGPNLHFEVRVRGAAVDPLPLLPAPHRKVSW